MLKTIIRPKVSTPSTSCTIPTIVSSQTPKSSIAIPQLQTSTPNSKTTALAQLLAIENGQLIEGDLGLDGVDDMDVTQMMLKDNRVVIMGDDGQILEEGMGQGLEPNMEEMLNML